MLGLSGLVLVLAATADTPTEAQKEFFEQKIRPVLVQHCYKCHSDQAKNPKGGLRVDSRTALLTGGETGPSLAPKNLDKSKLQIGTVRGCKTIFKNGKIGTLSIAYWLRESKYCATTIPEAYKPRSCSDY
jgi:hypothetical protein